MPSRQLVIVPAGTADEDAALAPGQRSRRVSGVFDTVPARLQEQALLRIHILGFGRRDIEKQWIEQIIFVDHPCPPAAGLARYSLARLIVGAHIPAALWDLGDAIPAFRNVPPKFLEIIGLGELTGHADHR